MKATTMFFITLVAAVFFWSSAPALAQRGQGRGADAGRPAGGPPPSIDSRDSRPPSVPGQSGTHSGRDANHPGTGTDSGQRTPAEHLAQSPKLSSKLQGLFPAGTNLTQQSQGFKNLGDFVSAAHVAHNLNIPFADLKTRMATGQSLGDAIHALKPDADHRAEERKAREQARKDLREAESRS